MKLEDIRLTEDEINDTWQGIELLEDFLSIANTATDKAIKKIVEYLMLNQQALPIMEAGTKIAIEWEAWQALKKLVTGGKE